MYHFIHHCSCFIFIFFIFVEPLNGWPIIIRQLDREFQSYQMPSAADFVEHFNEFSLQCQLFWRDGWQTKRTMDWERWVLFCATLLRLLLSVFMYSAFMKMFFCNHFRRYICFHTMFKHRDSYPVDFHQCSFYMRTHCKKLTRYLYKLSN